MNEKIFDYVEKGICNRKITDVIVHCSATKSNAKCDVNTIDSMHKARGFSKQPYSGRYCGYHFVICQDGTIQTGRLMNEIGAHCQGFNQNSIGICYTGGLDANCKATDTRTNAQKNSMQQLLLHLICRFGVNIKIAGHRDYSPDTNHNGVVDKWERIKECPCFDAIPEYKHLIKA